MKILNAIPLSAIGEGNLKIVLTDVGILGNFDGDSDHRGGCWGWNVKNIESYIGHPDLCMIINNQFKEKTGLELGLTKNRASAVITAGESFVVAQYIGPRLAEGTQFLPETAKIEYFVVTKLAADPEVATAELTKKIRLIKDHARNFLGKGLLEEVDRVFFDSALSEEISE